MLLLVVFHLSSKQLSTIAITRETESERHDDNDGDKTTERRNFQL